MLMEHETTGEPVAPPAGRKPVARRDFLALTGLTIAGAAMDGLPVMAGPFAPEDFQGAAPEDKRLRPEWLEALTARGEPTVYRGAELDKIGMPIGGIGAGQLYLGGDGRLWHWDIFNIPHGTGDAHYAHPPSPDSPLEQRFVLKVTAGGETETRALDRTGFADVTFRGQYPIGTVEYRDPRCPVAATLEAFSPFIPLNEDDSSLPATILQFTLRNTGAHAAKVALAGVLENAVCLQNRSADGVRRNAFAHGKGVHVLCASAERGAQAPLALRPDRVFESWSRPTYDGWIVEGAAFGTGPILRTAVPEYQGDVGGEDERVVNSHASAPGGDVGGKDGQVGKLTSRPFVVDRRFIRFWIGGGAHKGATCLNLIVDGKVVRSETGRDNNRMALAAFDVRDLQGREARIEIVDAERGAWGNIGVGRITFTDAPPVGGKLEELPDYGTMALALLGVAPNVGSADVGRDSLGVSAAREAAPSIGGADSRPDVFAPHDARDAAAPLCERLTGAIGREVEIAPGKAKTVVFVVAWHFPNLEIGGLGKVGRWYATKFPAARDVAQYVADNFARLSRDTRLWRDTWYDSTLPYWFLDRTLLNVSTLATSACYRFANGRFYAWEGVGCCAGTCTHVWHYAHAMARLFPALERDTRERVDFGIAFHPDTGVIGFRAEFDRSLAVDGQAGTLLRAYREHQMAPDSGFLARCWPRIKKAFDPLLALDPDGDGVLEGPQMNTLDQPWFGKVAWLSSLYAAALRAGEAMAREMGDAAFAERCRAIAERAVKSIDAQLFNGEYYQQVRDETRPKTAGSYDGCEIDQVFGDSWARQVGLPEVLPREHVKTALASLWRYNFLPDVGPFRAAHKPGRIYATAGEAGLIMCAWPKGEAARVAQGFDFYFNECMTGFEYQAAGHMLWEGMVTEGLAVTRAIHDRYHASRRNSWNEVECGDHYSRAMASYGVYVAACGLEVHGPRAHLGFAPRLGAGSFKAAFTSPEGWGTLRQSVTAGKWSASVHVAHGRLRLKTLALALPAGAPVPPRVRVMLDGKTAPATLATDVDRCTLTFASEIVIETGRQLELYLA
jgi:non-lysosomal glucosylceramidase